MERNELEALAGNLPTLKETREITGHERDVAAAHLATLDSNLAGLDKRIVAAEDAVKELKAKKPNSEPEHKSTLEPTPELNQM